jgi:hypothetical protein
MIEMRPRQPILVLLLACLASPLLASVKKQDDMFAPIPATERAHFIERLNLFFEYQRTRQREKLYDLLSDTRGESKKQFLKRARNFKERKGDGFVRFQPHSVTFIEGESRWKIAGCGEWRIRGRTERRSSVIHASLRDGEWYFTRILVREVC